MLVFEERGKPEYPEKHLSEQRKNQQQTQPTYDAGSGNQTWDTLVGGERSHHCTIPALPMYPARDWTWIAWSGEDHTNHEATTPHIL